MEEGSSVQQSRVLLPNLSVDIYLLLAVQAVGRKLGRGEALEDLQPIPISGDDSDQCPTLTLRR